jgi:hypothetical protein
MIGDPADSLLVLRRKAADEMLYKKCEVFLTLRNFWKFDFYHREPVVEILPELLFRNHCAQRTVRRRDNTDIDLARLDGAHALDFLSLPSAIKIFTAYLTAIDEPDKFIRMKWPEFHRQPLTCAKSQQVLKNCTA